MYSIKKTALINKQGDINLEFKHTAMYELHEENNAIDLFFNAKKTPNPKQKNLINPEKNLPMKKTVTIIRVIHHLSPTKSRGIFYYNHIKSY